VTVGSGTAYPDYVGFEDEAPDVGNSSLPPETTTIAASEPREDHGFAFWIPALGIALAGAGVGLGVAKRR
jgi:hypothetical protein